MNLSLKGRVALITGSSQGLGKAIALSLAKEGAGVIICGRNIESLRQAKHEIEEKTKATVFTFRVDATIKSSVENLFVELANKIGNLDILVNNVGGGGDEKFGRFIDIEDEDWQWSFNINVMTAVRFTRLAIPYLKSSDQARIINISSVPALQPGKFKPQYAATKAALVNLTTYLAYDLAEHNILVNTICPTTLHGGGWDKNIKDRAKRDNISVEEAERLTRETQEKQVPLGRIGKLEDVANLVTFLASDKAEFITGDCFFVDGGVKRSIF